MEPEAEPEVAIAPETEPDVAAEPIKATKASKAKTKLKISSLKLHEKF